MKRISLFASLLVVGGMASAQVAQPSLTATVPGLVQEDRFMATAVYRLWEDDAPDAEGQGERDVPTLTWLKPHHSTANGSAVIIAPGGAYLTLWSNLEGRQVADWFAARGVAAFVLRYRYGKTYPYPTPLLDAQRAIRFLRARAGEFGLLSDRIGMVGFSAGGHLTATVGTVFDHGNPKASDPIERVSSRPDFMVLGYPWLNAMRDKTPADRISYCEEMDFDAGYCESFTQFSPIENVGAATPPAFIYHTTNDPLVPVEGSVSFYSRLVKAKVPVEMHLFAEGPHGSALGLGDPALDAWPDLLEAWLRARGLLERPQ